MVPVLDELTVSSLRSVQVPTTDGPEPPLCSCVNIHSFVSVYGNDSRSSFPLMSCKAHQNHIKLGKLRVSKLFFYTL